MTRTWDMGDAEPAPEVLGVVDNTDGDCDGCCSSSWGRTYDGQWKGYKDGGKVYLDWAELVRRWGPVHAGTERGREA